MVVLYYSNGKKNNLENVYFKQVILKMLQQFLKLTKKIFIFIFKIVNFGRT